MPGDEVRYEGTEAGPRARTGPRHAAPKKPLITRLNMPAGKAIAIAAMPTSILMGMGLTPTLAHAKPQPENPFRDGPCVTAPDKDAEDDAKDKAAKDKAAKEKAEQAEKDAADEAKEPTPAEGDKAEPTPSPSAGDSAGEKADEPEPEPSPSESKNPLDPLGVGDKLKDLFTPDDKESETPEPEPSASDDAKDGAADKVTEPVEDVVDGAKDATDKVTGKAKDAADKAKDEADKLKPSADPMAPDADGKKPFPCVEEKKVDGDNETPPAPIPDDPWHLEASSLLLKGADYKGIVNLKTPSGKTKQVMKYIIKDGTDIGDLHQTVEGPGGETYHIESAKGATSTIRGGETVMYTERLSGHLFGLIPVTFDPEHPPPLNIPTIYFTKVEVVQAGQFGGNLTVPGFHQTITR